MSRFPKGLLLIAVLAELMILTVTSRTEMFPFAAEQPMRNVMTVAPALPDASVHARNVQAMVTPKAKTPPSSEVIVVNLKAEPHRVM